MELEELHPCNWCWGEGAVTVRIRLPVTGYCPGQTIPISVEVENQSSVEITEMLFEILTVSGLTHVKLFYQVVCIKWTFASTSGARSKRCLPHQKYILCRVPDGEQIKYEQIKYTIIFLQKELYRSLEPPSEYVVPEKVLASVKKGAVMSKSKRNFTCDLVVPDMIVPYLENCGIIDVGYFFRVSLILYS